MKWASAISENSGLEDAIQECVTGLRAQLGDEEPNLAVIFASPHHQSGYDDLVPMIRKLLPSARAFGCSGGGIIGNGEEVEQRPGLSITAAVLPGVEIVEFHLDCDSLPDLDA